MHDALVLAAALAVLIPLHLWLKSLHRRGVIHYRLGLTSYRSAGTALLELNAISQPKMHTVQEALNNAEHRRQESARGDAPPPDDASFWR